MESDLEVRDGLLYGSVGAVATGGLASVFVLPLGDDVVILESAAGGVEAIGSAERRRREGARGERRPDAAGGCCTPDLCRGAVGLAQACVEQASDYARTRSQFGRVIGTFQAVKHHCANMAVTAELATAAVWDASRTESAGGDEFSYAAAVAASLALPAADHNAQLNIQVHGGIGFTWEHDAHLYLRRATAFEALVDTEAAST